MFDFMKQVDEYCERTDFQFLSEPLNYFSNLMFWLTAYIAWRELQRSRVGKLKILQGLVVLQVLVGLGSGFFHSFATGWAKLCDVGFIGLFVLWFYWFWLREILRFRMGKSLLFFASFFVVSGVLQVSLSELPFNGSQGYFGVVLYLLVIGAQQRLWLSKSSALLGAGVVFVVSLTFRSLDASFCDLWPYGTHFLWHSLNSVVCYLTIKGMRQELEWRRPYVI